MNLHSIQIIINYWVTSTGECIPVEMLGDEHIVNIVTIFGRGRAPEAVQFMGVERRMMLHAVVAEGDRRGII